MKAGWRIAAAWLLAAAALCAQAGRPCEKQPLRAADVERGMALALATERALDAGAAEVVVLARAGQDLTNTGSTTRTSASPTATPRRAHRVARGAQAQPLRQRRGGAVPAGPGRLFLDRPYRYEAAFVVLDRRLQSQLLPLLRDNRRVAQWHTPRYNMLAYPWAQTYQQSNQWAIETLAGAAEPAASNRRQAQAWLQLRGYERADHAAPGAVDALGRSRRPPQTSRSTIIRTTSASPIASKP